MKEYMTEQRKRLLAFFSSHSNKQFSIEIVEAEVDRISKSAIYRNINKMVEEGVILRFQKEGCRKFFYQYVGCPDCNNHFHLKCNYCGVIYHMGIETSMALTDLIFGKNQFELDRKKTMLFGCCTACK